MADTEDNFISQQDEIRSGTGDAPAAARPRQSVASLDLNRLNRMLARLAGNEFRIALYAGEETGQIDEKALAAIAECYATLAREKWHENWTAESAREELEEFFRTDKDRINLLSVVYKDDKVVGLCWAFIFSAQNPGDLASHFSSLKLQNKNTLETTREWISQVGGREKLVSIRELGVLNQYRNIRSALLCAPVFSRARDFNCKYIFLRTPVSGDSLKWSQGLGFVPVHYFVVNKMLLMLGSLEETVKDYEFRILDYFAGQLSAILDQDRNFHAIMQMTEMDHAERMKVMQSLSANIAHEMRTPLSGVRASMDGLENYLPQLLETYREVNSSDPDRVAAIREDHLAALEKTPERISLMIDQANSVIDMLLMNLRDNKVDKKQFGIYSAAECISQAMDRYPFKAGERDRILLDLEEDFYFTGIDSLFIYVIFNLLKNALYSINSALKGEISIRLSQGRGINQVVFRDTGEGIEQDVLERIFDSFYSNRESGTGVGLAFCQRTIRNFGGEISCISEPGDFAEFTITLPAT